MVYTKYVCMLLSSKENRYHVHAYFFKIHIEVLPSHSCRNEIKEIKMGSENKCWLQSYDFIFMNSFIMYVKLLYATKPGNFQTLKKKEQIF